MTVLASPSRRQTASVPAEDRLIVLFRRFAQATRSAFARAEVAPNIDVELGEAVEIAIVEPTLAELGERLAALREDIRRARERYGLPRLDGDAARRAAVAIDD